MIRINGVGHALSIRAVGPNLLGDPVLEGCCACGWNHMTAYNPTGNQPEAERYLRKRWHEHFGGDR